MLQAPWTRSGACRSRPVCSPARAAFPGLSGQGASLAEGNGSSRGEPIGGSANQKVAP